MDDPESRTMADVLADLREKIESGDETIDFGNSIARDYATQLGGSYTSDQQNAAGEILINLGGVWSELYPPHDKTGNILSMVAALTGYHLITGASRPDSGLH
jgi:hypothetical protein